jgi:hypothetical protein
VAFKSTDFKSHFIIFVKKVYEKITSLEELKKEAAYNEHDVAEFFIMLNFGARSSKRVVYFPDNDTYDILNYIDDSYEEDLTEEQLRNETHIIDAIEKGAFFKYD